jgi:hypothetical protein
MFIESIKTPKIWNTMASESPRLLEQSQLNEYWVSDSLKRIRLASKVNNPYHF